MRPYSPGGMLNALAPARQGSIPATPSIHRLGLGLPGYLIPFATLAFAPQRQDRSRMPPSPRVFLQISTHFTATPEIPHPSPGFEPSQFRLAVPRVEPGDFTTDLERPPTSPLRPVNPNNASPPRITAAAGTELAGASFSGTVTAREVLARGSVLPARQEFTTRRSSSSTRRCVVRLAPIANNSRLLPPVEGLGRVSVPVWPSALSGRLPIVALVEPLPSPTS